MSLCQQCGFQSPPGFRFCGRCGVAIEAAPAATALEVLEEAERRQLTVLFCDLVGSTQLSEFLDPEDLRSVVCSYQHECAEVVNSFHGHIAQYLGDGLLVYFGYPTSYGDEPQSAARVGLTMVDAVARLNERLAEKFAVRLAIRVGIHTGEVVVGEVGSGADREILAMGSTPNVAARLQNLAEPNTVVMTDVTHRLVEDYFRWQSLGAHRLKGISRPMAIFRVLRESRFQTRFEGTFPHGLPRMVGREAELSQLLERFERASQGLGQVVLLEAEAGLGKSRLLYELKERTKTRPRSWWSCRCSARHLNSPLHPVKDLLRRLLGLEPQELPQEWLEKLEQALEHYRIANPEAASLLSEFLALSLDRPKPHPLPQQRQREKTLELIHSILLREAEDQTLVFTVEDVHWMDPSTRDFLELFFPQIGARRILVVCEFRPLPAGPWVSGPNVAHVTLEALSEEQVAELVQLVVGEKPLPRELVDQLVTKTDGVPLFAEELTKMVLGSDALRETESRFVLTKPLESLAIPMTLQHSLMARLDRTAGLRKLAQLASVLGREFSYEMLRRVVSQREKQLRSELTKLVGAEILYQSATGTETLYQFKHALIQDAAYASLLKSTRRTLHERIGYTIEQHFPGLAGRQPELLAAHFSKAGLAQQAVGYRLRAGQLAFRDSAITEAITHLTKGLEELKDVPEGSQRARLEIALRTALGPALIVSRGYAASEVEETYSRALGLCQQDGDTPELFWATMGLWSCYLVRAELDRALELAHRLVRLAEVLRDPALRVEALFCAGSTEYYRGEFVNATDHLEKGLDFDPGNEGYISLTGQDPRINTLAFAAQALWHRGYADQALEYSRRAIRLSEELFQPYGLAYSLICAAFLRQFRGECVEVRRGCERMIAVAQEHGYLLLESMGHVLLSWCHDHGGSAGETQSTEQSQDNLRRISEAIAAYRATGARTSQTYCLALLAECYFSRDWVEEAGAAVAEAFRAIETSGERFFEAELYRLRGMLACRGHDPARGHAGKHLLEAESNFTTAIAVARDQGSKSLHLRATISLSELWHQQGKGAEARELLAQIYGDFTEGFETADLKRAQALLETLGAELP